MWPNPQETVETHFLCSVCYSYWFSNLWENGLVLGRKYLEPKRTSMMKLFFRKYLTVLTWFYFQQLFLSNCFLLFCPLTFSWRSSYHIETSPLICYANQLTGFCKVGTSVMKKLSNFKVWLFISVKCSFPSFFINFF